MKAVQADLELLKLTKRYGPNAAPAVDALSLRIKSGELISLLGPSGCGKTTTLRMIAGLVLQTSGDIIVNGETIADKAVHDRNIGMVFQNYALFPHMSVAQNVAFGLKVRKCTSAERARRVRDALEIVQLSEMAERTPAQLSGGQQQRVALARALVIEPSVLLLDEPLGALDKNLRESMQVELRRIQKRLGITTVMVTHDQEEALTLSDRIIIMNGGKLEQCGTPEEVYCSPASRFVADFIGGANFFSGRVGSSSDGMTRVDVPTYGAIYASRAANADTEITVAVRPEDLVLRKLDQVPMTDASSKPFNQGLGTITEVLYKGFISHVHIALDNGHALRAMVHNKVGRPSDTRYNAGERIHVGWDTASTMLIV